MKIDFLKKTKGGLIVSCQALEGEPLYGSHIMSRMALAAKKGGACGIRANTAEDVQDIKNAVDLPIIGIIKQEYPDSQVRITPTMSEIKALVKTGVDVIAMDATQRPRPEGKSLRDIFSVARKIYPSQLFMADCSCFEDAATAYALGFDIIGTTLRGFTVETESAVSPDFDFICELGAKLPVPIIAEGGIWTLEELTGILSIPGVHAAVIGAAITRPQEITRRFVSAIMKGAPK